VNWSGLDSLKQAEITPTLASADNWIIFTHLLGLDMTITPLIPAGAKRILYTKGKVSRGKGWWITGREWWRTGTDKLASYGLDTEVWVSQGSTISRANMLALEEILQTESGKDIPDIRSDGVESIYWACTELGLMDIYNFIGVIYATDGSKSSKEMGHLRYRRIEKQ